MLQLVNKFLNTENITRNDILQLIDKIEIGAQCEHPKIKMFFKFSIQFVDENFELSTNTRQFK